MNAVFEHRHTKSNENPFLIIYPFPREIKILSGKLYSELFGQLYLTKSIRIRTPFDTLWEQQLEAETRLGLVIR